MREVCGGRKKPSASELMRPLVGCTERVPIEAHYDLEIEAQSPNNKRRSDRGMRGSSVVLRELRDEDPITEM